MPKMSHRKVIARIKVDYSHQMYFFHVPKQMEVETEKKSRLHACVICIASIMHRLIALITKKNNVSLQDYII